MKRVMSSLLVMLLICASVGCAAQAPTPVPEAAPAPTTTKPAPEPTPPIEPTEAPEPKQFPKPEPIPEPTPEDDTTPAPPLTESPEPWEELHDFLEHLIPFAGDMSLRVSTDWGVDGHAGAYSSGVEVVMVVEVEVLEKEVVVEVVMVEREVVERVAFRFRDRRPSSVTEEMLYRGHPIYKWWGGYFTEVDIDNRSYMVFRDVYFRDIRLSECLTHLREYIDFFEEGTGGSIWELEPAEAIWSYAQKQWPDLVGIESIHLRTGEDFRLGGLLGESLQVVDFRFIMIGAPHREHEREALIGLYSSGVTNIERYVYGLREHFLEYTGLSTDEVSLPEVLSKEDYGCDAVVFKIIGFGL